jgi:predicted DNA-binding helix-hairpin-helix protein
MRETIFSQKSRRGSTSAGIIFLVLILLLLASNVFWLSQYYVMRKEADTAKSELKTQEINKKVLGFYQMFVEKVLKSQGEISFETRLKLENSIRDIGDDALLNQWNKFVASKTEPEAQQEVVNLLSLLLGKIS